MSEILHRRNTLQMQEYLALDTLSQTTEVWMTIVESGWNLWVWLVGVVESIWVLLKGGIYNYIDFLILLIPTPLALANFCSSILTFVHKKMFFSPLLYTTHHLHNNYT